MSDEKNISAEEEQKDVTAVEKTEVAPAAAPEPEPAPAAAEATPAAEAAPAAPTKGIAVPVFVVCVVIAVVVGVLAGHFLLGGGSTISLSGKTALAEDQLDSTIATYTYDGKTTNVTAREVILVNSTLDNAKDDDGNYTVPTADEVISYVRNAIVSVAAEKEGITVTDDEVAEYASSTMGSDDYATIASQYGIDEDTAKSTLKASAIMVKLRNSVVTTELPATPTAPDSPADGQEDVATADYASYIINLAGDEWDSENNTWASTDGDYYAALSTYTITNDSATYAAAQAAYYVASSKYSSAYSSISTQWLAYVNTLLANATIQIGSLAV